MNIKAIEKELERADYRKDPSNGRWMKPLSGDGLPLTAGEQEVNDRGGASYGTDPVQLIKDEISEVEVFLSQFDDTYIDDVCALKWRKSWVRDAKAALKSDRMTNWHAGT